MLLRFDQLDSTHDEASVNSVAAQRRPLGWSAVSR